MSPSHLPRLPVQDRLARLVQKLREYVPGNTLHERIYQPGENRGYPTAQDDRFHLLVHSTVFLFDVRVVVEAPDVAVIVADRQLALIGLIRMRDLRDARRVRPDRGV